MAREKHVEVDFYKKSTTGILQEFIIPGFVGATRNPLANISSIENKGVDVEVGYKKSFNKLRFGINGNVSYLENPVTPPSVFCLLLLNKIHFTIKLN